MRRPGRVGEGVAESMSLIATMAVAGAAVGSAHAAGAQNVLRMQEARRERERMRRQMANSVEAANAMRLAEALREAHEENARLRRALEQRQALIDSMMRGRRVA